MADFNSLFTYHYSPNVRSEYERGGLLRGTINTDGQIIGDRIKWFTVGNKEAHPVISTSTDPLVSRTYSNVDCQIETVQVNDVVLDIHKAQSLVTPQVIVKMATKHGTELARAEDAIVIRALNQTPNEIDATANGFVKSTIDSIVEYFDENDVPYERRFVLIGAKQKTQLLSISDYKKTVQFNPINPLLATGRVEDFMLESLHFIVIGGRPADLGLPIDGNNKICFAWDSEAVGSGYNNISDRVERLPNFGGGGDYYNSILQTGAAIILPKGVVKIITKNN
jgi:hypothetical protein